MFLTVSLVQLETLILVHLVKLVIMELNAHQYAIFQVALQDVHLQTFVQNVIQVTLAKIAKLSIVI
jgi:hypothetical protein